MNKPVTFMWYSNDMFHYVFKAEFVTLVSLKVPSGCNVLSLKFHFLFLPSSPLEGTVTGQIPPWLRGSLLMNGPGKFHHGRQVVGHLFDGSALLQKYHVGDGGRAFYQCR